MLPAAGWESIQYIFKGNGRRILAGRCEDLKPLFCRQVYHTIKFLVCLELKG